jgi:histone deacetylase 1/2
MLEEIRNDLLHNLSKLQHAPSVPFQERPPDTETPEVDEDQEDGDKRWDPDSDMDVDDDRKPIPSRVKREAVEPDTKDKDGLKGIMERGKGCEVEVDESGSTKVTGVNPVGVEEASVKMEEEGTNKGGAEQAFPPKT